MQLAEKGKAKAIDPGMDDLEDEHEVTMTAHSASYVRIHASCAGTDAPPVTWRTPVGIQASQHARKAEVDAADKGHSSECSAYWS